MDKITCELCGFECKGLTLHLKYKHQITPQIYKEQFPTAQIFAKSVKNQMKQNSAWAKNKGKTFDEIHGEKSLAVKAKISKARTECTRWKHTPETIDKMKKSWQNDRANRCEIIREVNNRPEVKRKQSDAQKKRIAENGYHLARGKETKLELFVKHTLQKLGYTVQLQKRSNVKLLGTFRFFDIFVNELNLIIEADGEFWHNKIDRLIIDLAKTDNAISSGYSFLRISNAQFSRKFNQRDTEMLIDLLNQSAEIQLALSRNILSNRANKLF